jgi:hypothetical protein
LKINWDGLMADLIFCVVENDCTYFRLNRGEESVHGLKPVDSLSEGSLNTIKINYTIRELIS